MRERLESWLPAVAGAGVVFLIAAAIPLMAVRADSHQGAQPEPAMASAAGETPEASGRGGPEESLQVHGEWVIEVRDADGNLVERREFENQTAASGKATLAGLLGRQMRLGAAGIELQSTSANTPPCTTTIQQFRLSYCLLDEFNVASVSIIDPATLVPGERIFLEAVLSPTFDTDIAVVGTRVNACPRSITNRSNCRGSPTTVVTGGSTVEFGVEPAALTSARLTVPILLRDINTVTIKVTLSFS